MEHVPLRSYFVNIRGQNRAQKCTGEAKRGPRESIRWDFGSYGTTGRPEEAKWGKNLTYGTKVSHGEPIGGQYKTKGGPRDLKRKPKTTIWHPSRVLGNLMGLIIHLIF